MNWVIDKQPDLNMYNTCITDIISRNIELDILREMIINYMEDKNSIAFEYLNHIIYKEQFTLTIPVLYAIETKNSYAYLKEMKKTHPEVNLLQYQFNKYLELKGLKQSANIRISM